MERKHFNNELPKEITLCIHTSELTDYRSAPNASALFAEALMSSVAKLQPDKGTNFKCCKAFASKHLSVSHNNGWTYVKVQRTLLESWSEYSSATRNMVDELLQKAFGLWAVMSQDPDKHQVLREDEPESALMTASGYMPEFITEDHPLAVRVYNAVTIMD